MKWCNNKECEDYEPIEDNHCSRTSTISHCDKVIPLTIESNFRKNALRISPKQLEFLNSIYYIDSGRESYWECFRNEYRTAIALFNKGMIEFEHGEIPHKDDSHFMARMSEKGWSWRIGITK